MKRGQVYYVDFGKCTGSEQGGRRPCVIVQNDIGNRHSPTIIIVPITGKNKNPLPTHVETTKEDKNLFIGSVILTEQIQTVDKDRTGDFVCNLIKNTMQKVDESLQISLALNKEEREEEITLSELIHIGNADISVKEYNGQRVVTFKDIDDVHGRPDGTANKRFLDNKKRFVEGEDYFKVSNSEIRKSRIIPVSDNDFMDKILVTEQGYLMLVKSFTDDLAWEVQRQLVNSYFRKKLSQQEMMRIQLGMIDDHESRIVNLENNMTIDYGQQRVLEDAVNKTVIDVLGGKGSNAYAEIGRKVFAECNRDLKHYFDVNARNNVPKKRFDEALEYAKNWKPCTNTMMMIEDCNAQLNVS